MRALLLFVVAACAPKADRVVLPEPPLDRNAASLIIYFAGETTFFYAIDLESPPQDPLVQFVAPEWMYHDFTAVAFAYDQPLSFYGLRSGMLGLVQERRSCALQTPLSASTFDSADPTWQPLSPPMHGALGSLVDETTYGCDAVNLCRTFTREVVELPSPRAALILLRLDEQTALLGLNDGRFFEVTRSAILERGDLAGLASQSGRISESGEIWLGGRGRIARGTLAGGFVETVLGEREQKIGAIGVRGEGASLEAIAVGVVNIDGSNTGSVSIHHLADDQWTLLGEERPYLGATDRHSDVVWIGDEAVIVFGATTGLVWDGSSLQPFEVDSLIPLFESQLNDLAVHPTYGLVVAANDGFLHRRLDNGAWDALPPATISNGMTAVEAVFEGYFFGGQDGLVNQYYPLSSVGCGSQRLVASDVERIVQLGSDLLVTGGNPEGSQPNTVTWLSE